MDGADAPSPKVEVYLDHAASTPLRPEARAALRSWLGEDGAVVGNASSSHAAGRRARVAVEEARERVATALGAHPHDIVFTSGGTEADNLAVKGLAWAGAESGRRHLVVSAVEHPAVRDAASWLADAQAFTVTWVAPDADGTVPVDAILDAVRDDTAVVSVMTANNELGAVNDVATLADALADHPAALHTDAVQAFATLPVDLGHLRVDALALSAHKFGGPQGVGVAYLRRGVPIVPIAHGGGQDRGVRSGTFAAALDAACAAAVEAATLDRAELASRLPGWTDRLSAVLTTLHGVRRNGPADPARRLASHLHLSIDGVEGEALTFALDQAGVRASGGAACSSGSARASHVLEAAGVDGDAALRLSLGWTTTDEEVERATALVPEIIAKLRAGEAVT
ncbi:MAG: cysteine desulfurase [Actinobacteria bacterium]|nr:cysteine desulfurase [Actinomycetota bacterium]